VQPVAPVPPQQGGESLAEGALALQLLAQLVEVVDRQRSGAPLAGV
jgi:hypothetical protein